MRWGSSSWNRLAGGANRKEDRQQRKQIRISEREGKSNRVYRYRMQQECPLHRM